MCIRDRNDRDLLRATAVTRGWNGYRNKSQHRKLTLEKNILPPLQPGLEPGTFRLRVRRSNHWAIPAPWEFIHVKPYNSITRGTTLHSYCARPVSNYNTELSVTQTNQSGICVFAVKSSLPCYVSTGSLAGNAMKLEARRGFSSSSFGSPKSYNHRTGAQMGYDIYTLNYAQAQNKSQATWRSREFWQTSLVHKIMSPTTTKNKNKI